MLEHRASVRTLVASIQETEPNGSRTKSLRATERETIIVDEGDADGIVLRTVDGGPAPVDAKQPYLSWEVRGRRIERSDNPLAQARDRELPGQLRFDPRTLGLSASLVARELEEIIPEAAGFGESSRDGLIIARLTHSAGVTTIWLDPTRGHGPVRVRDEFTGGRWTECRSELRKTDGVWFPTRLEYFDSAFESGGRPVRSIELLDVELNRPSHSHRLVPGDIGLEPGMENVRLDLQMQPRQMGKWDGQSVVSHQEFLDRLRQGELREGESFVRAVQASAVEPSPHPPQPNDRGEASAVREIDEHLALKMRVAPEKTPGLWEEFVQRFIRDHKLDDAQAQKALAILKQCQSRADDYLLRTRDEFARASPREASSLLRPLERIFSEELHPRLVRLLTREQRRAATQPVRD